MAVCMMFMGFTCQFGGLSAYHGELTQDLADNGKILFSIYLDIFLFY